MPLPSVHFSSAYYSAAPLSYFVSISATSVTLYGFYILCVIYFLPVLPSVFGSIHYHSYAGVTAQIFLVTALTVFYIRKRKLGNW